MRHLLSVIVALVLVPLIYISTGFSAAKLATASGSGLGWGAAAVGLLAAFVAGALYAPLVMARLSPFGPVLGSLIYVGITMWALLDVPGFRDTMPSHLFGVDDVLTMPVGAGTLLLAVPMLFTVFSPRRWRGEALVAEPARSASGEAGPSVVTYEPQIYQPPPPNRTPQT